ncbi:MAG: DUF2089 domain-containing protein [Alicyclobacillus sp.]|nr:DUF2089 domain-containing protein [Alicyclobacillus sp.]
MEFPAECPACRQNMTVTELTCPHCHTRVQGAFQPPALWRLSSEQQEFVVTFLRCRGNIREVERELGISYPTVRARLDQVISALGEPTRTAAPTARDVLQEFEAGHLSFDEALQLLRRRES